MKLNQDQRSTLMQQVTRRLQKLDDEQLAELENQTRTNTATMAAPGEGGLGRRSFLRDVLIYTGAGLAVGGAAAFAKDRWDANQASGLAVDPTAVPIQSLQLPVEAFTSSPELDAIRETLELAQAELAELRPQLAAALTENANLQNSLTAAQGGLAERQQEADGLRGQLGEAQVSIGNYQGLVALFERLDQQALDFAVVNGLAAAAVSFSNTLGIVPMVAQGVTLARGLFDALENQFPGIRASLDWLKGRMDGLTSGMAAVDAAAEQALDRLDPVTNRVAQLIDYILSHLPFGIGRSIRQALSALNELYRSLPDLISGANQQVVGTLNERFGDGPTGLKKSVLQPVRENAFAPAEQLAGQVTALHESYIREVHDPLTGTVDRRNAIRKEIEAYRAARGL